MRILGTNLSATSTTKPLDDGAVAIIEDGRLIGALAEERITRHKGDSGCSQALPTLLTSLNIPLDSFDAFAVSSCCEPVPTNSSQKLPFSVDPTRVRFVPHHYAHAYSTFGPSLFENALVVVLDAGGNTLIRTDHVEGRWWDVPREQVSYFVGGPNGLTLLDRDFVWPRETGFGEMFRAFTKYLGFGSSRNASKVMALASLGNAAKYRKYSLFANECGRLTSPVVNDPQNPVGMILRYKNSTGCPLPLPRLNGDPLTEDHADVAAFLQCEFESALLQRVENLLQVTGLRNVCIAGGVALNCRAVGKLARSHFVENIFVPPVPGDEGQAFGAALAVYEQLSTKSTQHSISPYQGPAHQVNSSIVTSLLAKIGMVSAVVYEAESIVESVAKLLKARHIVGWYRGRSEYGPRALGNRSLLAHPGDLEIVERLNNTVKRRGNFNPFAPSVLDSNGPEIFEEYRSSPFMNIAFQMKPEYADQLAGVVHKDGTARVHSVRVGDNPVFEDLLRTFENITGIKAILNTSLNTADEPIVESPEDALKFLKESGIDYLALDRFLIVRSPEALALGDHLVASDDQLFSLKFSLPSGDFQFNDWRKLLSILKAEVGNLTTFVRTSFALFADYTEWFRLGSKTTTIRFRQGGIEIPAHARLPLFRTKDFGAPQANSHAGFAVIDSVHYKRFGELDEEDASRDGFLNRVEMFKALQEIYPKARPSDWVTIYSISPSSIPPGPPA